MANLVLLRNPLSIKDREHFQLDPDQQIIDWLQEHYPEGFGCGIRVFINDKEIDVADTDVVPDEDDVVIVMLMPAGAELFAYFLSALISTLVSTAISLIISALFSQKPKTPATFDNPDPNDVYNVSSRQNAARLGSPVPVIYGTVVMVPDYVSQPYNFYDSPGEQRPPDQAPADWTVGGLTAFPPAWGIDTAWIRNMSAVSLAQLPDVQNGVVRFQAYLDGGALVWAKDVAIRNGVVEPIQGHKLNNPVVYGMQGTAVVNWMNYWLPGRYYIWVQDYDVPARIPKDSADQYLDLLLCISEGDVDVTEVFVGDIPVSNMDAGLVEYHVIKPGSFDTPIGTLHDIMSIGWHPFSENMITSLGVSGQRFEAPLDLGWFLITKTAQMGQFIEFDISFPAGLYNVDQSTGAFINHTSQFVLEVEEVDADLNPIAGSLLSRPITITRNTNNPLRYTYMIDTGKVGRWQARVRRMSIKSTNSRIQDTFTWDALRMEVDPTSIGRVYGDVTLLAMRIKATEGVSGNASSRVRVQATRKLPTLNGPALVATSNPVDHMIDIYTNQVYGAGRPEIELDEPTLASARKAYANSPGFNGVFVEFQSVFDAMEMVTAPVLARPLALGSQISMIHDGVKPVRSQLFTEQNIVKDSFSITYGFDPLGETDGIKVEYRDATTFDPRFVLHPLQSLNPKSITLFGCTDETQAEQFAKVNWSRRKYQRKVVQFDTELEGHIPRIGERVGIQHTLPRWGQSAQVVQENGLVLTLNQPMDWTTLNPVVLLRNSNGQSSDMIPVSVGASPDEIVLSIAPNFPISTSRQTERTHVAFGSSQKVVTDFILSSISPQGGVRVTLSGSNYDERVYADGAPFLMRNF